MNHSDYYRYYETNQPVSCVDEDGRCADTGEVIQPGGTLRPETGGPRQCAGCYLEGR